MKVLHRNSIHINSKSHDMLLGEINGKKIKITYEAYNAVERCNTEIFDGNAWNHIYSLIDLGVQPDNSAFIWNEETRKLRADELIIKSKAMCKLIL